MDFGFEDAMDFLEDSEPDVAPSPAVKSSTPAPEVTSPTGEPSPDRATRSRRNSRSSSRTSNTPKPASTDALSNAPEEAEESGPILGDFNFGPKHAVVVPKATKSAVSSRKTSPKSEPIKKEPAKASGFGNVAGKVVRARRILPKRQQQPKMFSWDAPKEATPVVKTKIPETKKKDTTPTPAASKKSTLKKPLIDFGSSKPPSPKEEETSTTSTPARTASSDSRTKANTPQQSPIKMSIAALRNQERLGKLEKEEQENQKTLLELHITKLQNEKKVERERALKEGELRAQKTMQLTIDVLNQRLEQQKTNFAREMDSLKQLQSGEIASLRAQLSNSQLLVSLVSNIESSTSALGSLNDRVNTQRSVAERSLGEQLSIRENLLREKEASLNMERKVVENMYSAYEALKKTQEEERGRLDLEQNQRGLIGSDLQAEIAALKQELKTERRTLQLNKESFQREKTEWEITKQREVKVVESRLADANHMHALMDAAMSKNDKDRRELLAEMDNERAELNDYRHRIEIEEKRLQAMQIRLTKEAKSVHQREDVVSQRERQLTVAAAALHKKSESLAEGFRKAKAVMQQAAQVNQDLNDKLLKQQKSQDEYQKTLLEQQVAIEKENVKVAANMNAKPEVKIMKTTDVSDHESFMRSLSPSGATTASWLSDTASISTRSMSTEQTGYKYAGAQSVQGWQQKAQQQGQKYYEEALYLDEVGMDEDLALELALDPDLQPELNF